MPLVQQTGAEATGVSVTSVSVTLPGVGTGHNLHAACSVKFNAAFSSVSVACSDTLGTATGGTFNGQTNTFLAGLSFTAVQTFHRTTASGDDTITFTFTLNAGIEIVSYAIVALEYSDTGSGVSSEATTGYNFGNNNAGGTAQNGQNGTIIQQPEGEDAAAGVYGENFAWQPNTGYITFFSNPPLPSAVRDTTVPNFLQQSENSPSPEMSGSTPPAVWGKLPLGTPTTDGAAEWNSYQTLSTLPGYLGLLSVSVQPFIEFPPFVSGDTFILRASRNNADVGIAVYDFLLPSQVGAMNAGLQKTAPSYGMFVNLNQIGSGFTAPGGGGVRSTFTGMVSPGQVGGGTK